MSLETNASEPAAAAPAAPETTKASDLPSLFLAELEAERAPPKVEAPKTEPAAEPATETPGAPPEAAPETESEVEETEDAAKAEPDDAAETPSEAPAIAAPSGMNDADKAEFAKLPTEMKAWVTKRISEQTADYTRKSQAVAEHKKQLDSGLSMISERVQALDAYLAKFTDPNVAPPDPALRLSDPIAYDEQLSGYLQAQHNKELAGKERQRLQTERQRIEEHQWKEYVQQQDAILQEKAPEFYSDKGPELKKQVLEYGQKQGYSLEQLQKVSAADILTLHKAMRFDAIEAAKKQVKPVPPPAPTSAKPGPAKAVGRPSQLTAAIKNLDEKPSRAALADAYLAEIRSERR